jgi:hypothetical protein
MPKTIRVSYVTWKELQNLKDENDFSSIGDTIDVLLEVATPERMKEWWKLNGPKMEKEYEEFLASLGLPPSASDKDIRDAEKRLSRKT